MQTTSPLNRIIGTLNLPNCRNIALTLLSYLGNSQIASISEAYSENSSKNYFISLIKNLHFINNYINRTDKSLYFNFYCQKQFYRMEIQKIAVITHSQTDSFLTYHKQIKSIMSKLQECVPSISSQIDILSNLIVDPDLPIPKLRRETEGMYCSSPLQLLLVDCNYQPSQEYSAFENFQQFLCAQKEQQYLKQFINILKQKHASGTQQLHKIIKIRYTPYEVSSDNFTQFFIQNNQLHNFIVSLFALTDVMVQATHEYIIHISDPLDRLVQLLLRYSIYRNYILGVQEYLSFVFRMYDTLYQQSIEQDSKKPKYNFWRPALTKWYLKMNHLHDQVTQTYIYCITKIRSNHLKNCIADLYTAGQVHFSTIYNKIELNNYQYQLAAKIFKGELSNSSQLGLFFDSHPENYEIIAMEFNEYLTDISINEQTVHWCGHSDHQIQKPYLIYQQKFIRNSQQYVESIKKLGFSKEDLKLILTIDVQYLSVLQIKNRTLKKIIESINLTHQLAIQNKSIFDFLQADRKLQYFNNKAFILSSVDVNQKPFYSISPQCSVEDILAMIDTNQLRNTRQDKENFQYRSQVSEDQQVPVKDSVKYQKAEYPRQSHKQNKQITPKTHCLQDYKPYKLELNRILSL